MCVCSQCGFAGHATCFKLGEVLWPRALHRSCPSIVDVDLIWRHRCTLGRKIYQSCCLFVCSSLLSMCVCVVLLSYQMAKKQNKIAQKCVTGRRWECSQCKRCLVCQNGGTASGKASDLLYCDWCDSLCHLRCVPQQGGRLTTATAAARGSSKKQQSSLKSTFRCKK